MVSDPSVKADGRSPHDILLTPIVDNSSWHFFQSRSWLDYAKREKRPSAIHYAAFELRYGIEYLLFELLMLSNESLTFDKYQKCLRKQAEISKMLETLDTNYYRLTEFTKIVLTLEPGAPNLRYWDIKELFKYWGIASEYLHFIGIQELTYRDPDWLPGAIARLSMPLDAISTTVTETLGIGLIRPSTMPAEVHTVWLEFSKKQLSDAELLSRLRLLEPELRRPRNTGGQY